MQDAFELVNYHANEVMKIEMKKASTVALVKVVQQRANSRQQQGSKLSLALHDAREYVAKTRGFDIEGTLLIPQHQSYGIPTTVEEMARPQRATVLIGGHTDGIKYIARHLDQYGIKNVVALPNVPV